VVVRTKTVHRNLKEKANRVRNPKGQTWVASLVRTRWVASKVANRDSLARAAEVIRAPNQEEPIPTVQALLTETGSRMFPALKTTIQIWTRIWTLIAAGHVPTGHPTVLPAEEICDCTINYFKKKNLQDFTVLKIFFSCYCYLQTMRLENFSATTFAFLEKQ
jgi:hypothetical protein